MQHTTSHTTAVQYPSLLHTHTPFYGPLGFCRTTWVSQHQKVKTNLDSLEQEIVSGSGISWVICKSAL